jgi:outer membrane protein assembly factor BamB
MKTNSTYERYIAIWIVLLLTLAFIPLSIVSSTYVYDTNDGVFFDDFENFMYITDSKKCVLNDGIIKLQKGEHSYNHDFADDRGHEAWDLKISSIFSDDSQLMRTRNFLLQNPVDTERIEDLDDEFLRTESTYSEIFELTFSPVHHFRFNVGKYGEFLDHFEFAWHGNYSSYANIESVQIYVWNYSAFFGLGLIWEKIGDLPYSSSMDFSFVGSYDGYISDGGYMDFLVVALPYEHGKSSILETDYVNVSVTTTDCYAREGYVVSPVITKPLYGKWESTIWNGSPLSSSSSLKIHVLDSTGDLIEDFYLDGNSDGFNVSPFDLSILSDDFVSIKIKASFESVDLIHTSWLTNWAVTWQVDGGRFTDDFNTVVRIDKAFGVKSSGGKIEIDSDYGDWLIYGKNPENTRSYEGYGPSNANIYRYTEGVAVGGGLRSPILSDGIIYIASSVDKKLYTFDAYNLSLIAESSELPYVVDSSVAIADNLVIVATSEIQQSNKIYALNKSTLVEEWSYTFGNGTEDICFSSAPTICDGKIFVTSWNGMGWDMPLVSFLYELHLLKGNNKIIALNLSDGAELWNASLSSGSFSTPAVADSMVFVGCDNVKGNSLFAFDQETGVKIWETSVGLVGRSSPVVYDEKVFIVVKDQNLISFTGDVKAVAIDEYDGTLLWDTTIAVDIPSFEALPKSLQLYNIMATSTPAVYESALFVTTPDGRLSAVNTTDGEALWNVNLPLGGSVLLPLYPCTSPVATANGVYATSANGFVHAVSTNGEKLWDFRCITNLSNPLDINYILAAPIVADGVLYVSVTEEAGDQSGRIYSIGDITTQQRGKLLSNPIHVPKGKWWNKFTAQTAGNGEINFSILDEHHNVLLDDVEIGDDVSNTSIIDTDVIRLCAEFLKNGSENPLLYSWGLLLMTNKAPAFDINSFIPDPDGWTNTYIPLCSVNVSDEMPGLDVDSARYKITYLSYYNETETSDWNTADCSGEYGTVEDQVITADISSLNISEDIAELKSITISVEDLAGYESKITIEFKMDEVKPTSNILDVAGFSSSYNESVVITADADDSGILDVNKSGIRSVTLYFRKSGEQWSAYETDLNSPYSWLFGNDVSGSYEFCTIATDNAGNVEDYPSEADLSFVFDMNNPNPPVYGNAFRYRFNDIPEFSGRRFIRFSDDFKLKSIEYRLDFYGIYEWAPVNLDVGNKNYDEEWNLTSEDWEYMKEDENYTLYFRLTDSCGNQYITPEDEAINLVKDLTASKVYLDLSDFANLHWDNRFSIVANMPEDGDISSVGLYYRYSSNRGDWSDWKRYRDNITTSPYKWSFVANEGSGYYEFKARAVDYAGNIGESITESISLTIFPLIQAVVVAIMAFILLIVTINLIKKIRFF